MSPVSLNFKKYRICKFCQEKMFTFQEKKKMRDALFSFVEREKSSLTEGKWIIYTYVYKTLCKKSIDIPNRLLLYIGRLVDIYT